MWERNYFGVDLAGLSKPWIGLGNLGLGSCLMLCRLFSPKSENQIPLFCCRELCFSKKLNPLFWV